MQDKKEIGKKIWDLFIKNYSYSQIAKELGISKSVVSNVINYSLPSDDWCDKNIKKLKEKYINEIKKRDIKLKKAIQELQEHNKKEKKLKYIILALIIVIIILLLK